MDHVQTEKHDVWCVSEILSGEEISEYEKHDVWDESNHDFRNSHWNWQSPAPTGMSSVGYRAKELPHKESDGDEKGEDHETKVDVAADVVVLSVGDWAWRSVGVVWEEAVGNAGCPAGVSAT